MLVTMGEGSGTPTEPHHTPTSKATPSPQHELSSSSLLPVTTESLLTGRSLDEGEEAAEKFSDDTEEMATVLTSMDAASILTSGGVQVVPTAAEVATTTVKSTPYTRRKGKETMVESKTPEKKKGRSLDEGEEAPVERSTERGSDDTEEMVTVLTSLDATSILTSGVFQTDDISVDTWQQFHYSCPIHQSSYAVPLLHVSLQFLHPFLYAHSFFDLLSPSAPPFLLLLTQQRMPLSREQQKEFYMSVLKSHSGWKAKHFKGMTLEEIKEKFDPVWKQIQDFVPIGSKEEGERFKRKGLRLEQDSPKKVKISKEVPKENLKEMMQLIPVEEHFDREDLNQLWTLVKETLNIRQATSNKEKELSVELKRLYEPDVEDLMIHQYLQNEHYALWEVIEFGDSYEAPKDGAATGSTSNRKKGRTIAVTTEDMQKRRNDVKARNTLLLALPDEHQLRFIKYKMAQELWVLL
nr:hypothetical protein [Tanacetum cinerariifolium]